MFAAAAHYTMRSVRFVKRTSRRDCRAGLSPLQYPHLDMLDSGTVHPPPITLWGWEGEELQGEGGRKPSQGWLWEDESSRKNICLEMLLRF